MTEFALISGLSAVLATCGVAFGVLQKKAARRNVADRRAYLKERARRL